MHCWLVDIAIWTARHTQKMQDLHALLAGRCSYSKASDAAALQKAVALGLPSAPKAALAAA